MTPEEKRKRLILMQRQKAAQVQGGSAADRIAAARAGTLQPSQDALARAAQADQVAQDQITLAGPGLVGGVAVKAGQGLPFVGEWLDEGLDAIDPGRGARMREIQGAMDRQRPKTSLAAEIGGGVVGSIPLAMGAVGAAGKAATTLGKVTRGAAIAGAGGAVEGALSGAGRRDDNRAEGAATGALIGGGFGAVLGGAAPLVADGASALAKRVKKLDVRTIAREFGISPAAARTVREALDNDDLAEAGRRLSALGDDAMLADAGPSTSSLLDAASQTGGRALRTARDAVEGRATQVGQRTTEMLDRVLGPADGVRAAARGISRRTSAARQAAYDRAYSTPINYADATGRRVEEVLSRIPRDTLNSAIKEANDAMRAAGVTNAQIMAQIADDGSVVFREMPNVQQLDEIKKALGTIGREAVDQFGRPTAAGSRAIKLAGELRDAIADAAAPYARAVKLGGDKIAEDRALDMGRRILSRSTTLEDARDVLSGMSVEARAAAKRGLREQIENTLSNVRATLTDPNTDAREAMKLVTEMSSRANIAKVRLVLGSRADDLFRELERTEAALALRASMAQNSKTAIRQAIQGQVKEEVSPGAVRSTLGNMGNPLEAAQGLSQWIAGIDPRSMSGAEKQVFAEIADALTRIRGPQAARALEAVNRAMQGQPLRDEEARLIGRLVAGTTASAGYQSAEQSLAR